MVPTVLEALDIEPPASIKGVTQSPMEGISFAHAFDDRKVKSKHNTQYFEMMGHRSIYHEGWKAVCPWPGPSFAESGMGFGMPIPPEKLVELDAKHWELYHVEKDFTENHNLAETDRARLIEMIASWYVEAGKYNVLPIDGRGAQRFGDERPSIAMDRKKYIYYQGTQSVPAFVAAIVLNRSHSISADAEIPEGGAEGVLISHGGNDGGYTFYVKDGKLHYIHNYVAKIYFHIESVETIPVGRHQLRYEFEVTGKPDILKGKGTPGRGQLYIDEKLVGQIEIPVTSPIMLGLTGGVTCGADPGSSVTPEYEPPFVFTGKIYSVAIDVSGELIKDTEAEIRAVMARQ